MDRTHAFKAGLLGRELGMEKSANPVAALKAAAAMIMGKGIALGLGLPIAAGAVTGAAHSKLTSPTADAPVAQKELVLAELEEALVEMRRRQAASRMSLSAKPKSRNERSLHI
jgi:hypothetical protein